MSTKKDRFEQLVHDKLAPILESSSSTYVPHALGDAYALAISDAADDPQLAQRKIDLLDDERTIAALGQLPADELSEICRGAVDVDPREILQSALGAEEAGYWDGPPEGGMNSGTAAAIYEFACNGLRYLYEWDFDCAGDQFWCGDGHDIATAAGKADFESAVADWSAQFDGIYDD